MKISEIAARLRIVAINMEVLAARDDDYYFPDEMVLPLVVNSFADDAALRFTRPANLCLSLARVLSVRLASHHRPRLPRGTPERAKPQAQEGAPSTTPLPDDLG